MKIIAPTNCPSCDTILARVNAQLFCQNTKECPAQSSKRVQNFCKKLKIKGFGEATLDKLGITNFNEIVRLTAEDLESRGLSAHMANKLVEVVKQRLQLGVSPNDFLAACSVPLIGDGAMRKLKFDVVSNITYDMCKTHGLGDMAATSLVNWIKTEWDEYRDCWEQYFVESTTTLPHTETGLPIVCITGKLNDFSNRSTAATYLESLGFTVKSGVTKQVQYLICEDGSTSSSYKKAVGNGIPVTTIKILEEKYVKSKLE